LSRDHGKAFDLKAFADGFGEASDIRGFAKGFCSAFDLGNAAISFVTGFRDGTDLLTRQAHRSIGRVYASLRSRLW